MATTPAVQGVAVSRQSSLPEGFLAPPGAGPTPRPPQMPTTPTIYLALALQAEEDEAERQQAELYASQQPQPTQPPPQYHYHSQQGQPGQQPPPQSGRGGAYRPFDAPMDGYPGAERPPRRSRRSSRHRGAAARQAAAPSRELACSILQFYKNNRLTLCVIYPSVCA